MTVRLLVIMGSGETAPTMVKPHRAIFERLGEAPAVLMDTPYGFQSNADDISSRAVGYFAASVGRSVDVVTWRVAPPAGLARERALTALRDAGWTFAGPGSPTYAMRQWRDTPVPDLLAEKLASGGVVVFASAAALTLGSHTVPVYEIYKAGFDPEWAPGLDLVRQATGLPAVVIPHYDNAEGGHHDTRFCYLGEQRLSKMEKELPDDTFVIGVDEHTAAVFDLDAGTVSVVGNGQLTIRRRGTSVEHGPGSVLDLATLGDLSTGGVGDREPSGAPDPGAAGPGAVGSGAVGSDAAGPDAAGSGAVGSAGSAGGDSPADEVPVSSLRAAADALEARFADALSRRDADACVEAILDLEQVLIDWSADTLTSDEGDHARATLRRMIVRLGELATVGARDPRDVVGPYVEALLDVRRRARESRDFASSDLIRDQLTDAGVEVRDTPEGVVWELRPS